MAYESVKNQIDAYIKANGVNLITGPVLNAVLTTMLDELGEGYAFQGILNTTDTPSPAADIPQAWLASAGTYLGGSITVDEGELALIIHTADGWSKETIYRGVQLSFDAIVSALGYTPADEDDLAEKQDTISDLPAIRSGAALGSTSVQPVDIEDMVEAEPIGSIIPPVNPSEFATKEELSQLSQEVAVYDWQTVQNILAQVNVTYGFQNASGGISGDGTDQNWFHTDFIPVKQGSTISVNNVGGQAGSIMTVGFFDENYTCLTALSCTDKIDGLRDFVVNDNSIKFVRFSGFYSRYNLGTCSVKMEAGVQIPLADALDEIDGRIDTIEEEIADIEDNLSYEVWERNDNVLNGYGTNYGFQNGTGGVSGDGTDTNWFHTDFFKVRQGDTLVVNDLYGSGSSVMTVGFFDKEYNCLTALSVKQTITTDSITINNTDIAYVRFSGSKNHYSSAFVKMDVFQEDVVVKEQVQENTSDIETLSTRVDALENADQPIGTKYGVNHFICFGQSLSQGDWIQTVLSNTQKYNSLMFTGTPRVWEYRDQANKYAALLPAVEDVFRYQSGEAVVGAEVRGETPCCGTAEKMTEMVIAGGFDIDTYQYQILVSAPGMGGLTIAALGNPSGIYYQRLLDDVTHGKSLANAAGKTYAVPAIAWIQGESDCSSGTSYDAYYSAMVTLFDNLNTDIKAITEQTEDVHFYLYQTRVYDWYYDAFHYPYVPLAQLAISLNKKNVHMAGPIYQMPLLGDYCHFTAESSKWFGGYIGRAMYRTLIEGNEWKPVHLESYEVVGNYIFLHFYAPTAPLVFDTTNVPDKGVGKGFQIRNADDYAQDSYLDIITAVDIVNPTTVRITCSESPIGKKLTYAINGTATPSDRADMGSGNLRDSSQEVFNFPSTPGGADVAHPLYNWCPLFEQIL